LFTLFLIVHVIVSILLIVIILLQQSKGGMSEMFGGNVQENPLSNFGTENFLTKTTAVLAVIFMLTSFSLAMLTSKENRRIPQLKGNNPVQPIPANNQNQNEQGNPTLPLNNLPTNEGGK